jgi:hypothetical protein
VDENFGVTTWDIIGLVLFTIVTKIFYGMVKGSLEQGLTPGYTLDIFVINLFSQFILCFTRYGWYVYLLVPCYIGYKVLQLLWGYIGNTNKADASDETAMDPKEAKRLAKKEKKEERGQKVKYIRK